MIPSYISVLYYMKAYESWLSLTPIQLPPRTRVTQVSCVATCVFMQRGNCHLYS